MKKNKSWLDYLWLWTIIYFVLGFFNILFAWLGMIDFILPLLFAIFGGNKFFCNKLCGRGQLFSMLPKKFKCSTGKTAPGWLLSRYFKYGFLAFFMIMFMNIIYQSWLVFGGAKSLNESIKLFWTFNIPFHWAYTSEIFPEWSAQFAFGFYSLMLTSALIGLIVMMLYRPRTWCVFCPMGTMTQIICRYKNRG